MDISYNNNDCPICHGVGSVNPIINGETDYSRTVICECRSKESKQRRINLLLKLCTLPPFAQNMRFDNFRIYPELKTAYETAKHMADNPNELCWLALLGNNGNGKTHLAVSVCRAWVEKGIPAKYKFVSLLLDELRNSYKSDNPDTSYEAVFQQYCDIPLLLLDDYGAESKTGWVQEKLDALVDYRLMNNKSLIVTSNLSLDEMPDRIRSRLMRHPKSRIIAVMSQEYSLRGKK